jgi:uncharacterized protein (TIGR02444 family)
MPPYMVANITRWKRSGAGGLAMSDLWQFSLGFYARPGVAPALIALQDRDGCDVNLVLYALWLGLDGCRLDPAGLEAAAAAIAPLQHGVVEPLRALRRRLKDDPDLEVQRLRERVKALELEGEEAIQHRLAALSRPPATTDAAAAEANLALCLEPRAAGSDEAATLLAALAAR